MEIQQTHQGEPRTGPSTIWTIVSVLVVLLCLSHSVGCDNEASQQAAEMQARQNASQPNVASEPRLALLSSRGYPSDDNDSYYYVEGQVKNISEAPLSDIEVSVTWYTKDGQFITSDSALVKYNPILPEQISPFETITIGNPRMAKYTVEFQAFDSGTVNTLDLRSQTAATAARLRKQEAIRAERERKEETALEVKEAKEEAARKAQEAADRQAFEKKLFQNMPHKKNQPW